MKANQVSAKPVDDIIRHDCCVCGKKIDAPYGRNKRGWTCSKRCETTYHERNQNVQLPEVLHTDDRRRRSAGVS